MEDMTRADTWSPEKFRSFLFAFCALLVTCVAVSVLFTTTTESLWGVTDTEVLVPDLEEVSRVASLEDHPVRLKIPSIDIDAYVQEVGITAAGNMATPNNFNDVGWYKYGTLPGFKGSAVIAGHVDNGLGLPGVFTDLADLQLGDDIYVLDKGSEELRFRVVGIQEYPYTLVPREILFSRDDTERLNLITCGGTWVPGERTYDRRLIVYTELVSQ